MDKISNEECEMIVKHARKLLRLPFCEDLMLMRDLIINNLESFNICQLQRIMKYINKYFQNTNQTKYSIHKNNNIYNNVAPFIFNRYYGKINPKEHTSIYGEYNLNIIIYLRIEEIRNNKRKHKI